MYKRHLCELIMSTLLTITPNNRVYPFLTSMFNIINIQFQSHFALFVQMFFEEIFDFLNFKLLFGVKLVCFQLIVKVNYLFQIEK